MPLQTGFLGAQCLAARSSCPAVCPAVVPPIADRLTKYTVDEMDYQPHTGERSPPTHYEVPDGAGTWSLASSFADRLCHPTAHTSAQHEPWPQQPHPPADPYAQHQLQVQQQLRHVLPSPRPLPSPVLVTVVARYINTHELVQPLPPMPQGLSPFQQAAWLQLQLDALKQSGSSCSARVGRPHIKDGPFLQLPFPIELRVRHGGICCKAFGVLHLDRYGGMLCPAVCSPCTAIGHSLWSFSWGVMPSLLCPWVFMVMPRPAVDSCSCLVRSPHKYVLVHIG